MTMIAALILLPLLLAPAAFAVPSDRLRPWLLPLAGSCHLALALMLIVSGESDTGVWLAADPLGRLVLVVSSLLFFGCSIYAVGYLSYRMDRGNRIIVPCLLVFLSAMTLAALARHLGLLWLAVETTTLASAPLIYYNRNRLSIEATWKYLMICSVGIALAMLGILFVAYAALHGGVPVSLQLDDLMARAGTFSRPWLHAGFVFLLVGFGTKMGLAPLHSWKPDAYGEAPGLVGALLAGGLTSVAFLAILRGMQIMAAAGDLILARQAMLGLGLLSLALAAVFMIRQPDMKRLLAYSSVEHVGIMAVGFGLGSELATFGALLHMTYHTLAKPVAFFSAGTIAQLHSSSNFDEIGPGTLGRTPAASALFLLAAVIITGSPPFGLFFSEMTILKAGFAGPHTAATGLFLACLVLLFCGFFYQVGRLVLGEQPTPTRVFELERFDAGLVTTVLAATLAVVSAFYLPQGLLDLIHAAARVVEGAQ
jgi:hydrogenase-4 component F